MFIFARFYNANESLTTSISPSNELENKLNARISELLKENEKWKIAMKKFTISQKSVNTMLDDIGGYVNRQGLGYKKTINKVNLNVPRKV